MGSIGRATSAQLVACITLVRGRLGPAHEHEHGGQNPQHHAEEDQVERITPRQADDSAEHDREQEGTNQEVGKRPVVLVGDLRPE